MCCCIIWKSSKTESLDCLELSSFSQKNKKNRLEFYLCTCLLQKTKFKCSGTKIHTGIFVLLRRSKDWYKSNSPMERLDSNLIELFSSSSNFCNSFSRSNSLISKDFKSSNLINCHWINYVHLYKNSSTKD